MTELKKKMRVCYLGQPATINWINKEVTGQTTYNIKYKSKHTGEMNSAKHVPASTITTI